MRRVLLVLLLPLVLACGWFGFSRLRAQATSTTETEVANPERRHLESVFRATGRVVPAKNTEVKSEVSGRITKVFVEPGDTVAQGQPLVQLDPSELESEVLELSRMIESARLRAEKMHLDRERKDLLHRDKLVSEQQYEDARIDAELAENELEVARARLDTAKQKLSKTTIYAPHEGVVLNLGVREGMVIVGATSVSAGTVLMEVAVLDALLVEVNVNEVDIGSLKRGMPAKLKFDSLPDVEAAGEIVFVSPSAIVDPDNKNLRHFSVTIGFPAVSDRIRPGITANVEIMLTEEEQALSLPVPVVFTEKDKTFVYRGNGTGWERRDVVTGIADGQFVQIKSGLEIGDTVARTRPPGMPAPKP